MSISLSFKEADGYLFITVKGPWSLGSVSQAVKDIGEESRRRGHTRILVDARLLDAPTIGLHRFSIGEEMSEHWRGIKAAVVRPAELVDKFGDNTPLNRGAQVKVLADVDEALRWLLCRPMAKSHPTLH